MGRFAGLKSGVLGLMLVVLACMGARIVAASQAAAAYEFPVVDLSAGDSQLWEHKLGPDTAIHVPVEEYETQSRLGPTYLELEIVVSENGRVDAVKVVGDDHFHHGEEALVIGRARLFKPWMQNGAKVRVRVRDYVNLLPPEQWAEVRVPFPEQWDLDGVKVKLTRTVCFGSCPGYEVTVAGDGTVSFSGDHFVAVPGAHVAHVSTETVRALVREFQKADFFSAKDRYQGNWTDNPTQTLGLTIAGRTKVVVDYVGTDAGLPLAIRNLEAEIDEAAGTARWVKGDERTLASLEEERWPFGAATKQNVALYASAISTKNKLLVEHYLAAGGPIVSPNDNAASPVCVASGVGDLGLVKQMMEPATAKAGAQKKAQVPIRVANLCLLSAAHSGSVDVLQYWLDKGADPIGQPVKVAEAGTSELSPLANGIMSGKAEMVRKLLDYKVDLQSPVQGEPLLIFALTRGGKETPEMVEMLVMAGADVNVRGHMGETPIFEAQNSPGAVKSLLAAGADLEARDQNGNTALIRYGFMEPMVRELLADGADPSLAAKNGDTALKIAKQYQCPDCATLIEAALKEHATKDASLPSAP
jgi:Domain of unknown function (DUF6438)